ncbi:hypothetical protein X975_26142, partial [Stegodyphus mimosarum]
MSLAITEHTGRTASSNVCVKIKLYAVILMVHATALQVIRVKNVMKFAIMEAGAFSALNHVFARTVQNVIL